MSFQIHHHGAVDGVTGSCHELCTEQGEGLLVDCGLFQGDEHSAGGTRVDDLSINFPISHIKALIVTHVHIDHVGRIPYLLAAGFKGPIICSVPSAELLPLVLEDALKIGFTRDHNKIQRFIRLIKKRLITLPYNSWHSISEFEKAKVAVRLKPAGHILGSAYVLCRVGQGRSAQTVLFSGDLGAPWAPLLAAPKPAYSADIVVLESTYGDRLHEGRRRRREKLKQLIEHALKNRGTVLIPSFSIGRTQELLYEFEALIHDYQQEYVVKNLAWEDIEIIVDSPLASRFTEVYKRLRPFWDKEAKRRSASGRHPLSFAQLTTIDSHQEHRQTVEYLAKTGRPSIVIAANGMCSGGRIVNYLKLMIQDDRHDVLFVGFQARGTPGNIIQRYGSQGGYVE